MLETLDENKAIKEANSAAKLPATDTDIARRLPPVVTILSPTDGATFASETVTVKYRLRSPSKKPIAKVEVLVDGRPLSQRGLARIDPSAEEQEAEVVIPVPAKAVTLSLIGYTEDGAGEAATVALSFVATSAPAVDLVNALKPKLYALLIGVSAYAREDIRLDYAHQDAEDLAGFLAKQKGLLYGDVTVKLLTDANATFADVRKGFSWLKREMTDKDVALVFMAGHGFVDTDQVFYYLPQDADPDDLAGTAVSNADILKGVASLPGKVVMFIDACQSAAGLLERTSKTRGLSMARVDVTGLVNELASTENGIVMFASSTGSQLSFEDDKWQNGAFTEALLVALGGQGDLDRDGAISIAELNFSLSEQVKALTGKKQVPVMRKPDTIPDFPLMLVAQ